MSFIKYGPSDGPKIKKIMKKKKAGLRFTKTETLVTQFLIDNFPVKNCPSKKSRAGLMKDFSGVFNLLGKYIESMPFN